MKAVVRLINDFAVRVLLVLVYIVGVSFARVVLGLIPKSRSGYQRGTSEIDWESMY